MRISVRYSALTGADRILGSTRNEIKWGNRIDVSFTRCRSNFQRSAWITPIILILWLVPVCCEANIGRGILLLSVFILFAIFSLILLLLPVRVKNHECGASESYSIEHAVRTRTPKCRQATEPQNKIWDVCIGWLRIPHYHRIATTIEHFAGACILLCSLLYTQKTHPTWTIFRAF